MKINRKIKIERRNDKKEEEKIFAGYLKGLTGKERGLYVRQGLKLWVLDEMASSPRLGANMGSSLIHFKAFTQNLLKSFL